MSFETFQVICYTLLVLDVITFCATKKFFKRQKPKILDLNEGDSKPVKEYRGKIENVSAIISIVCIGLIFVGFMCEKFEFLRASTRAFLIANGIIFGILAIPVFFVRRFNRMRICETKIILPPAARRVRINGKTRLYTKKIELDFTDIVSVDRRILTPYNRRKNSIVTYEIKLNSGDVIEESFSDLNEYQKQQIVVFLLEKHTGDG